MIRILHITNSMKRGGIETLLMNIYRKIDRQKVQFDFLLTVNEETDYTKEIKDLGGKIFYIPGRRSGVLKYKRALKTFFDKNNEYKIVHQHVSSLTNIVPLVVAKKSGIPVRIVHSHNTKQGGLFIHKYLHYINRFRITSIATEYYACSKLAANWLYPNEIIRNGAYKIINNSIETKKFIYNKSIRELKRKEFGFENEIIIGHVGRFAHQKNHDFLIDIFEQICKIRTNCKLLLIGEGPLKNQIFEKVREKNLEGKVIFAGVRSDIPELLQAMDVFVMPSFHEGLPVTIVEAQAADLPCVLSDEITNEVQLTQNVRWLSLSDNSYIWAKGTVDLFENSERGNTFNLVVKAGYDSESVALELQNNYLSYHHNS